MEKSEKLDGKVEKLSAVLLTIAIIATAWCVYQASTWGGVMAFKLSEVNANTQKFVMNTIQQGQYSTIDILTFIEYVNALNDNNESLSDFYYHRFRQDFKPAVDAWLETNPLENPDAPPHPLVMPEYKKQFTEQAEQFASTSKIKLDEAVQANRNSDSYVLLTVIYSSVLFLGGVLGKFRTNKVRITLLLIGISIFAVTTVGLVSLPVAPELSIEDISSIQN